MFYLDPLWTYDSQHFQHLYYHYLATTAAQSMVCGTTELIHLLAACIHMP